MPSLECLQLACERGFVAFVFSQGGGGSDLRTHRARAQSWAAGAPVPQGLPLRRPQLGPDGQSRRGRVSSNKMNGETSAQKREGLAPFPSSPLHPFGPGANVLSPSLPP